MNRFVNELTSFSIMRVDVWIEYIEHEDIFVVGKVTGVTVTLEITITV